MILLIINKHQAIIFLSQEVWVFGVHDLWLFLLSCLMLNLIPGQDSIYIVSRSMSQGRRAGIVCALGINTGAIFHVLFASLGLSALILSFSYAFEIIKVIGALYLMYLGIAALLESKSGRLLDIKKPGNSLIVLYKQAILTNILNPKVALFFLAFLPQFVDIDAPYKVLSFLLLGGIFLSTSTLWCLLLAFFAALGAQKITASVGLLNRFAGVVYIALGLKLLLQKR